MKAKVNQKYVTWQIHTALQFLPGLTAFAVKETIIITMHHVTQTSGLSASPAYRICTAKNICCCILSNTSFTRQGSGIFQAVTQYVTQLAASIHTELYCLLTKVTRG